MFKPRRKKFVRSEVADPLQLQPRDIELLHNVAEFRFLNTPQILAFHKGGERNLHRRLISLFQHGYLDRPKSQTSAKLSSAHMVYTLGRKGAELLSKDAKEREGIYRRLRENERTLPLIAHSLMISQFRICLTLAAEKSGVKILRWLQGQDLKELLRTVHGDHPSVVHDAFFTILHDGQEINLFLEADRGNMQTGIFVKKLKWYWSWRSDNRLKEKLRLSRFRVLTITPSERRSDSLRNAGKSGDEAGTGSLMFLFTPETEYSLATAKKILEPVWKSPKDETPHSILE
ncbi:MAG: replication-relaxation family protein [Candidatus Wildermuthbacteria bacterium]|nr:replication-relaxation family protein [Candidatus Wildermuthbacteria bacterium]